MTADEYFEALGLAPLDLQEYERACFRNLWHSDVQRFAALDHAYREEGSLRATQAWYAFTYTTKVPGLDLLWCEAYTRMGLDYEQQVLPVLLETVRDAQTILVLGCGEGLELLFLAANLPDAAITGMDLRPEGLALARARADRLGLTNVTLLAGDAFGTALRDLPSQDWVVARNLLDDARIPGTDITAGEFDTVRKISALRPLVRTDGRLWVSLTSAPYGEDLDRRLTCEFLDTGFQTSPARPVPYASGHETCTHLVWTLWPLVDTGIEGLTPRSEYVPKYHYPRGRQLPFQDFVLGEQCYRNLSLAADTCPRCGQSGAQITHQDGPARTKKNFWKVWARLYSCNTCARGYLAIEVLD